MLRVLFHKFYHWGAKLANIGISPDMSFHERKKTQLLNTVISLGIITNCTFSTINLFQGKYLLTFINALLLTGGITILIINSYRKFLIGRLILTFMASVVFTASAVFYRNGAEYFLIANLLIIIIYFNEKRYLLAISIVNCGLFIAIKFFLQSDYVYDAVSFGRVIFNIMWALGAMILALLFFKNEQVSYQQMIEEKNRDLQKLNDTKEKLFSIISHDLRSPIGQLKSSLDLVKSEDISPESFRQISTKLSEEVSRLQNTLDNLLKWSISQLQGIQAAPERVSLKAIMDEKLAIFDQMTQQKKIRMSVEDVDRFVWVDPNHLRVVLRNLISNAIKYSYENGSIIIKSSIKEQMVVIEVIDTGMGMNEQIKQTIFQPENIVSSTGTANEKGTGIGLKLCKEFIEKNHGQIWAESSEKKGSTFFISLPEAK